MSEKSHDDNTIMGIILWVVFLGCIVITVGILTFAEFNHMDYRLKILENKICSLQGNTSEVCRLKEKAGDYT